MRRARLGVIWLGSFIVVLVAAAGGLWVAAGRAAPPQVVIGKPERLVGQLGSLEVTADAPQARFEVLTITLEQNGRSTPLFALDRPQPAQVTQVGRDRLLIARPLGKQHVPELQQGAARIVVVATRRSFLNLRPLTSTTAKEIQVTLERPRLAAISTRHY